MKENRINELNTFISNHKPTINNYISVKNYVQQNYSDAPPLQKPSDYTFIEFTDNLIKKIAFEYRHNQFDKFIGDFIISYYKKDKPEEQSIWNSDVARLTYVIKELMGNNKSYWHHDYKGIKTKEYIVDPFLLYIKDLINTYLFSFKNLMLDKNIDKIELSQNANALCNLNFDMEKGLISENIIKYIAPYFSMDKNLLSKN